MREVCIFRHIGPHRRLGDISKIAVAIGADVAIEVRLYPEVHDYLRKLFAEIIGDDEIAALSGTPDESVVGGEENSVLGERSR